MSNPCCCIPLQRGTYSLAMVDGILNFALMILYVILLDRAILVKPDDPEHGSITPGGKEAAIVIFSVFVGISVVQICLAIFLCWSARKESYGYLRCWLIFTIVLFLIGVVDTILRIGSTEMSALDWSAGILWILCKLCEILVVIPFMFEVRAEDQNNNDSDDLTGHTQVKGKSIKPYYTI